MSADYGTDVSAAPSIGTKARLVSGRQNYIGAILRRYTTPKGSLFYAPNYGDDLRDYLNREDTEANRFSLVVAAAREAEGDPRTIRADAELLEVDAGSSYKLRITLETDEETVDLILAIDRVTVEVLNGNPV